MIDEEDRWCHDLVICDLVLPLFSWVNSYFSGYFRFPSVPCVVLFLAVFAKVALVSF